MINPSALVRTLATRYPDVVPLLSSRARLLAGVGAEYKTVEFFTSTLERMIRNVYSGNLGGEFIDIMASLIQGQLTQAYEQAWKDEGGEGAMPEYLTSSVQDMILNQYTHVDSFYREIVDARVDETPLEPLLARAQAWAHQWDVAYKEATLLIRTENGGNLEWVKGNTEQGCSTCAALDGIVAPASVWEQLGVHPRGYPNSMLECEGGGPVNNCDCELKPTDKRRSPKAFDAILNIISK